jgi:hypothetical protein
MAVSAEVGLRQIIDQTDCAPTDSLTTMLPFTARSSVDYHPRFRTIRLVVLGRSNYATTNDSRKTSTVKVPSSTCSSLCKINFFDLRRSP